MNTCKNCGLVTVSKNNCPKCGASLLSNDTVEVKRELFTLEKDFNDIETKRRQIINEAQRLTNNFKDLKIKTFGVNKKIKLDVTPTMNKNRLSVVINDGHDSMGEQRRIKIELNEIDDVIDGLNEIKKIINMSRDDFDTYVTKIKVAEKL